ncbi:MAG: hypothetical protein KDH97_16470 [Calditrichaeota bacterium]|nr:hypothetical protein [Calditrichota bacterium]MCB9089196.1 hypothetical protein [Calditrichia bacterium]MCB0291851.1 hypothetical protein [Calditrichota bacterium]MCB0295967.1 hypothetical protein [Calditrichota bacterium]MCB0302383.1 hypothetical protein [Calditrichota bacterium]
MKRRIQQMITGMILIGCAVSLNGQNVILKPYYGYYIPRMADVNAKIDQDMDNARIFLQAPVPDAGKFDGEPIFGGQFEYHAGEDYFFNVNFFLYQEQVTTSYQGDGWIFNYEREVEMFDFVLNMHYYFNYNSWRRLNKYIGLGVGLLVLNANSLTFSTNSDYLSDSKGEFNSNTLTGVLSAGLNYRLSNYLQLWGEGGVQFGNFGQIDGKVSSLENPEKRDFISDSSFDMTGFFLRGGLGIGLPFLH